MTPTPKLAAVERALVAAKGSVSVAARLLGIASAELRKLVRAHPLLADEAFEQIEQKIDAAQQVLRDGLRSLQLAFRESSAAPDEPGRGPGEKYTGPVS